MTVLKQLSAGMGVGAFMLAIAAAGAVFFLWITDNDARRPICDKAAERLFHSNDPAEVQRSIFLIRRLDCGIASRVPSDYYLSPSGK